MSILHIQKAKPYFLDEVLVNDRNQKPHQMSIFCKDGEKVQKCENPLRNREAIHL